MHMKFCFEQKRVPSTQLTSRHLVLRAQTLVKGYAMGNAVKLSYICFETEHVNVHCQMHGIEHQGIYEKKDSHSCGLVTGLPLGNHLRVGNPRTPNLSPKDLCLSASTCGTE